jgi:hypothetical protein
MSIPIEIILKASGGGGVKTEIQGVATATKSVDTELKKVGSNTGFTSAEAKAKGYWQAVDTATEKTANLSRSMVTLRNGGAALTVAGGAAMALTNHLANVYKEGARADEKLSAMLQKRGEGGRMEEMSGWASKLADQAALVDDDPIKEASAGLLGFGMNAKQVRDIMPGLIGQSRLYGQELEGVAMAMGKAFAKGDVGALVKSGVTLDPKEVEKIKAITDFGERQAAMFAAVKTSMDNYALSITDGMSEAEKASNRFKKTLDDTQTAIGKGSAAAETSLGLVGARILGLVSHNPKLAEGAGLVLGYGAAGATAVGGVATFAGSLGQAYIAIKAMKAGTVAKSIATDIDTISTIANTDASIVNATAVAADGNAAGVAAGKFGLLARAKMLAANPFVAAGALAVVAGLGIKSVVDAQSDVEDARAEGKDRPESSGSDGSKASLIKRADEMKAQREKLEAKSKETVSAAERWGYTSKYGVGGARKADDHQRDIDDAKIEAQSLKITEDLLRKRIAAMPAPAPFMSTLALNPAVAALTAPGASMPAPAPKAGNVITSTVAALGATGGMAPAIGQSARAGSDSVPTYTPKVDGVSYMTNAVGRVTAIVKFAPLEILMPVDNLSRALGTFAR